MATFAAQLTQREGIEGVRRRTIVNILEAALAAVDPAAAVRNAVQRDGSWLHVGVETYDLRRYRHVRVVGAGKAGASMAQAVEQILGPQLEGGIVNVKYGHMLPLERISINEAGHPIPDEAGVAGARRIAELLQSAGEDDLVLCLISGGGSALMTLPAEGIALADIKSLTDALLRRGANIVEINTLRKHVERTKGGNLARLAYPAQVVSLILSDVVGNPLDAIASGPTVPDSTTFADAWEVLQRYDLVDQAPAAVVDHLRRGVAGKIADTPKPGDPALARTQNLIIAGNDIAARAAEQAARANGLHALVLSTYIEGEAREVAKVFTAIGREVLASGRPAPRPACIIAGGETTVTVRGSGMGGRNQEMALAAAIAMAGVEDMHVVCLATDGSDGPTDASGALADGGTVRRAAALGRDARRHLHENDAYPFFNALGDLLLTGPTRTNVNDLTLVFVW
ncbi:MAG: glycerate kinase type-2 family protein [Anaerolineae bacterium]